MEIERMLVDIKKNWNDGEQIYTRRSNSHSFYWKFVSLLKLDDLFEIPKDINNLKDSNLLLQKKIKEKDAKKAVVGSN